MEQLSWLLKGCGISLPIEMVDYADLIHMSNVIVYRLITTVPSSGTPHYLNDKTYDIARSFISHIFHDINIMKILYLMLNPPSIWVQIK